MRCQPCDARHDEGEQADQRNIGYGIDGDEEGSSHGFIVLRAPGLQLRQPWKRAENVPPDAFVNEKALRLEGFPPKGRGRTESRHRYAVSGDACHRLATADCASNWGVGLRSEDF
jgi:hypothetical protein